MPRSVISSGQVTRLMLVAWSFLALVSCRVFNDSGLVINGEGPGFQKLTPDIQSIQSDFVNQRCLSCHSEPTVRNQNVWLGDIFQVIEGNPIRFPGARQNLIKPGCPKQSFLMIILKSQEMPPRPNPPVDGPTLKILEDWILSLSPTPRADCDGDEPAD